MLPSGLLTPRGWLMPRRLFDRLPFGDSDGSIGLAAHGSASPTLHSLTDYFRYRLINGTGVGLLLGNAELGQHVNDGVRGDLKLPCELIDSNFTHK
jgi:hypothetical protein